MPGPWRGTRFGVHGFTKRQVEWVGGFRKKTITTIVAELEERGIACVVSGGHGYLVDIEKKTENQRPRNDTIIDLITDPKSESFYISPLVGLKIVDKNSMRLGLKFNRL